MTNIMKIMLIAIYLLWYQDLQLYQSSIRVSFASIQQEFTHRNNRHHEFNLEILLITTRTKLICIAKQVAENLNIDRSYARISMQKTIDKKKINHKNQPYQLNRAAEP